MLVIRSIQQLQTTLAEHRLAGRSLGLIPTMGNLHQGHLQLVKTAQQHANVVMVSLFVNPTQFGANEDLDSYPRTFQQDIDKLEALDTDQRWMKSIRSAATTAATYMYRASPRCYAVPRALAILTGSPPSSASYLI